MTGDERLRLTLTKKNLSELRPIGRLLDVDFSMPPHERKKLYQDLLALLSKYQHYMDERH